METRKLLFTGDKEKLSRQPSISPFEFAPYLTTSFELQRRTKAIKKTIDLI